MRQSVINYVKENGIKLAANSKALKLINNGASEAEVAVALQTTKAYKGFYCSSDVPRSCC